MNDRDEIARLLTDRWMSLPPSQHVEDRRGEALDDQIGDLLRNIDDPHYLQNRSTRQDEEDQMLMQHNAYGRSTDPGELGVALGADDIDPIGRLLEREDR